jgi:hypothetical protein
LEISGRGFNFAICCVNTGIEKRPTIGIPLPHHNAAKMNS